MQLSHEPCPKFRPLDSRFSKQRPVFDTSSVQVGFMSDKLHGDKFLPQYFAIATPVTISLCSIPVFNRLPLMLRTLSTENASIFPII